MTVKFIRKAKVGSAIPTASMADISFLLLVFFMVSTVFVRYRGVPVELPEAEKIEKLESRRNVLQAVSYTHLTLPTIYSV